MRIDAIVTFLTAAEGGRTTPPASGYRPPVWFGHVNGEGVDVLWDFQFAFPDLAAETPVTPGDEVKAYMRSSSAGADRLSLEVGQSFEVREGTRVVARGRVRAAAPD